MKKYCGKIVKVSTLALLYCPFGSITARAQVLNLTCNQNIDIGKLIEAGCNGKYEIGPDNVHSDTGCLILARTAQAGNCEVRVTGGLATRSATLTFTKNTLLLSQTNGPGTAKLTSLRMKIRAQPTITTKLIFNSTSLNGPAIPIDIGGTLNYSNGQSVGNYTGNISLSVNFN